MTALFLTVFNMAVSAGWISLAVMLGRWLLRKRASRAWIFGLWGAVALRLMLPFSPESVLSLIPSAQAVPPTITTAPVPQVNVGLPVVDQVINPVLEQTMTPPPQASVNPMEVLLTVAGAVWLAGMAGMLINFVVRYWHTKRLVRASVPLESGVRLCDEIAGAFVLGVLRPRVYVSSQVSEHDRYYMIAHERAHLQRGDHYWRLLGYFLLSVYWFHPLMWVSYVLMGRDMEFACDEKVIKTLGKAAVKPYALTLTDNGLKDRPPVTNQPPVAFGGAKTKERVMKVLNYKKPTVFASILTLAVAAVIAVCFLTNPVSAEEPNEPILPPNGEETVDATEVGEDTAESTTSGDPGTEDVTTVPDVDPIIQRDTEIKQAYVKHHGIEDKCPLEWLQVDYYGNFDGAHVMFVDGYYMYTEAESWERVGDIWFPYVDGRHLLVCDEGNIYSLSEAYSKGILTENHVSDILDIHFVKFPYLAK